MKLLFQPALLCLLFTQITFAQTRYDSIPIMENGKLLKNAWAGGLNSCQFSHIDINNDGFKDLYVIDNSSKKVSTFINGGTADSVEYKYADEYRNAFPEASEWVRLIDFDGDGINDFFKSEGNNISVYKGSYSNNIIQFTLHTDTIFNASSGVPINVDEQDIPDVVDVNMDGDLDILGFDPAFSQVNYYENQSMELYGHADSLIFTLEKSCWGYFNEDFTYNGVELGICPKSLNHAGGYSSLLALDMDGDDDLELLVGDYYFRNMVLLTNTTLGIEANFTLQDTAFPSNTTPIDIMIFPLASYLDIDNDNVNELLVSTHVEFYGENKESVLYYENTGANNSPVFSHIKNNLFQDEMVDVGSGAYPVFFDYNNDGLLDLVIGNTGVISNPDSFLLEGSLSLYENYGNAWEPKFKLITEDYANLRVMNYLNIVPTFGDLDGDGDSDLLIGEYNGILHFYENISIFPAPANFILKTTNYQNIDVDYYSAPQLFDVNRDGKLDLLLGNWEGVIAYHKDTGTVGNPAFKFITDNFGDVKVSQPEYIQGYSIPHMFEDSGEYKLIVGSENGFLHLYSNIDGNLDSSFTHASKKLRGIYEGKKSAASLADINGDGFLDMIVGNAGGGIAFYKGDSHSIGIENHLLKDDIVLFPNPSKGLFTIDFGSTSKGIIGVSIYNSMGNRIPTSVSTSGNSVVVDLSNHSNGVYFVILNTRNQVVCKKIMLIK